MNDHFIPNGRAYMEIKKMGAVMFGFFMLVWLFINHIESVSAEDHLTDVLNGIRKQYADLPGLSIPYQREIISSSMALLGDNGMADQATGEIFLKSPYLIRVEQKTPDPETLTSDGKTLWWYIPMKKQVFEYPSARLGKELFLFIDIFLGLKEIGESFDVMQSGLGEDGAIQLTLIPNPRWEEIDHINILVDRNHFQIRKVEIQNTIGGITRFILGKFNVEKRLTEDFFRFAVPEDVTVIKEDG
ncbi:MAG: outer membrane lipoprotein carrier protein LolA [Deltaproteobacteria bacterium]|nr:outer membrane lipoprotein carrier protein LolA [Deltaproteobacteria bacterium]